MTEIPIPSFKIPLRGWVRLLLIRENRYILFYTLIATLFTTLAILLFTVWESFASPSFQKVLGIIGAVIVVTFNSVAAMFFWKKLSMRPCGIHQMIMHLRQLLPKKQRTTNDIADATKLPASYIENYCETLTSECILRKDKHNKYYWIDELRVAPFL